MSSQPTTLPRVLGPWLAAAIVVGTVIGTGVFKKGLVVSKFVPETGPAVAVWVIVGLLTLCGTLALAEVASLLPHAGGNYVFLREAYGRPFGFLWGWVEFWFLRCASCAALSSVFADSLSDVLTLAGLAEGLSFWPRQVVAAVVVTALGLLAARGTRLGAGVQLLITTVKVGSIVALMILPVIVIAIGLGTPGRVSTSNLSPAWPDDWGAFKLGGFAAAMVAVMWPYNGWSNAAAIAGEITEPQRNIPRAFIGGVLLLILIYSAVNASYYLVIPVGEMAEIGRLQEVTQDTTPVATLVAERLLGPVGKLLMSAAIMTSIFGALGGNMLVGPRGLYALSRDGLVPAGLSAIHPRYQTPVAATLAMTGVTVAFIVAVAGYTRSGWAPDPNKPPFDVITDFIVFGAAVFETMAVASIFVFRRRHPPDRVALPYRCPGYPAVPAVFVACMVAVLVNMFATKEQRSEALIGLALIAAGGVVYLACFTRRRK